MLLSDVTVLNLLFLLSVWHPEEESNLYTTGQSRPRCRYAIWVYPWEYCIMTIYRLQRKNRLFGGGLGWTRTSNVSNVTILQTACFTNLHTNPYWAQGRGLNPYVTAYEAVALPNRPPCELQAFRPGVGKRD